MYTQHAKIKFYLLCIAFVFLSSCVPTQEDMSGLSAFHDARGRFRFADECISLNNTSSSSIQFSGAIWYDEEDALHKEGRFGLHWSGGSVQDVGSIPIDPYMMITSPSGKTAIFGGFKMGEPMGGKVYLLEGRNYQKTNLEALGSDFVLTDDDIIMYASADREHNTISANTYNLKTGETQKKDFFDASMSDEPLAQLSRTGILAYDWYRNFDGPRLVLLDAKTGQEIGRYKDISYTVRPSWYGRIFDQQGTRIISISDRWDGDQPYQQELFGVQIGKTEEPLQVTDFHAKYPYTLISGFKYPRPVWSPNDRWIVLDVLISQTKQIDSSVDTHWLFLIDLEKSIGYQICQELGPKDSGTAVWSPDSQYFALSRNDKIWVVNPQTLESRLLVDRPGVPLSVLGWTIP